MRSKINSKKPNTLCDLAWLSSKNPPPRSIASKKDKVRIVDLFCGCGGMTLGACEAIAHNGKEMEIVLSVDMEPTARSVYARNFSTFFDERAVAERKGKLCLERIERLIPSEDEDDEDATNFLKGLGRIDILMAGPPCQGHSNLNNHTRRSDERNNLYMKVVKFAEVTKPRLVIIENVASALRSKQNVVERARLRLEASGYDVHYEVLDSSTVGVAQSRKRLVLVASSKKNPEEAFSLPAITAVTVDEAIGDLSKEPEDEGGEDVFKTPPDISKKSIQRIDWLFENGVYDLTEHRPDCHKKAHKYKSMYGRIHGEKPAQTITTGFGSMGQGRYVHPSERRLITPHEAARIQGFPDHFQFFDLNGDRPKRGALQKLIGNAVPPGLTAHLLDALIKHGHLDDSNPTEEPQPDSNIQDSPTKQPPRYARCPITFDGTELVEGFAGS